MAIMAAARHVGNNGSECESGGNNVTKAAMASAIMRRIGNNENGEKRK